MTYDPARPLTQLESCLASFGELDFWFKETTLPAGGWELVGFAPQGRVGVVQLLETEDTVTISLLVSADTDRRTELWSAICLSTLARMLDVDFPLWLGDQIRRNGVRCPWSSDRRFGSTTVSAAFFPVDSMLVTVESPRHP